MRTPKEILDQIKKNQKEKRARSLISRDVINNVPGSFERYLYFIRDNNGITDNLDFPFSYISLHERKKLSRFYFLRETNTEFNYLFLKHFMVADILNTINNFLITIL
jgi:hypothetical protein